MPLQYSVITKFELPANSPHYDMAVNRFTKERLSDDSIKNILYDLLETVASLGIDVAVYKDSNTMDLIVHMIINNKEKNNDNTSRS